MGKILWIAIGGVVAFSGCANVSEPSEGSGSTLELINMDELARQTLYMDGFADRPATAAEVVLIDDTTPVRMEFGDDIAMAWWAPFDEPVIGRDSLIGVWLLYNPREGGLLSGGDEVVDDPDPPSTATPPTRRARFSPDLSQTGASTLPQGQPTLGLRGANALIDWQNRVGDVDLWEAQILAIHPGCL